MRPMHRRLRDLPAPIRVAIVGAGAMGKGLLYQCLRTAGLECVALCDARPERALDCARSLGVSCAMAEDTEAVQRAAERGHLAICTDGELAARCPGTDALIEASSAIVDAARYVLAAIDAGKHVVLMNAEVDLAFGPYLLREARANGVVYTSCDGDQHGVIKRVVDEMQLWGFDVVMGGNVKGFLDRRANPTTIVPEADKRRLDYRMATAYTDGSKLCIEMALLANGLGLSTPTPGMTGPRADHVEDVFQLWDVEAVWSGCGGFVDYVLGARPGGGVFVIGHCVDAYQREMLAYYKMGPGPLYLFYRPYHLCHVEAAACIAEAVLDGRSLLAPAFGLRTDVMAYAKRPLRAGEQLDGLGGYCVYGLIENRTGSDLPPGSRSA